MYRALSVPRRAFKAPAGLARSSRRRGTRTFTSSLPRAQANEATAAASSSSSTATATPKKKRGFFRTLTLYSTGFVVLFYAASPVVAFNNERYHAFFVESVPLGERIVALAEDAGLDDTLRIPLPTVSAASIPGLGAMKGVYESVVKKGGAASEEEGKPKEKEASVQETVAAVKKAAAEKVEKAKEKARESKERAKEVAASLKTTSAKTVSAAKTTKASAQGEKKADSSARPATFSEGVEDLVKQVEAALSGKPIDRLPEATTTPEQPGISPPDLRPKDSQASEAGLGDVLPRTTGASDSKKVYPDLPIGFDPPPGYARPKGPEPTPAASKAKDSAQTATSLPKVAVAVADVASSEPVIAELASTIDALAAFLKETPGAAGSAKPILDTAQADLKELAARIDQVRREEHDRLEAEIDQQAREYSMKLLESELSAQDKLDEQELEFKQFFEEEQRNAIKAYREKLDAELRAQSEIINERLKQEVVAQGIEMQRRWIREIKVRVEQERGGRLGRLDELAANLKKLERVTLDNAEYLDANLRLHAMWAAIRAVTAASVESGARRPFRDELRVLRHASAAQEDPLVSTVLDALERTDVPDVGVEPLADLTTWFTSSVAPQIARVALVPEQDAGVLSYLTSHLISSFRFARRGLVDGDDVLSVLARAEHFLNEKDLDNAARELNQLKGAPKVLLGDWLEAARKRLEVLQALEVIQAEATRASLLVV